MRPTVTAKAIENLKPREKPYTVSCGNRLVLLVTPSGGKWWRMKYRFNGKERGYSLGTYPQVSLAEARQAASDAGGLLLKGIDPAQQRKEQKEAVAAEKADTFKVVAAEWLDSRRGEMSQSTVAKAQWMFDDWIYPAIGDRPVTALTSAEILKLMRDLDKKGNRHTAQRVKARISEVLRYANATGRVCADPTQMLRGALGSHTHKHRASITKPAEIGQLLLDIDSYQGQPVTQAALRLAPLVFVRPRELRKAEWSEFDLDAAEWCIPAERMKMDEQHIVPLSKQAVAILRELYALTGHGKYVFPTTSRKSKADAKRPDRSGDCLSENTINSALRKLGYAKDEMTGHGFRSMASTRLNESNQWRPDAIERQLAHAPRDKVRGAYNYAEHLPERRLMMQAYADYLDELKAAAAKAQQPKAA